MDLYTKVVTWLMGVLGTAAQTGRIRPADIRKAAFGDSTLTRRQARSAARAEGQGKVWSAIVSDRYTGALLAKGLRFIKEVLAEDVLAGRTAFWLSCLKAQKAGKGFTLVDLAVAQGHLIDYAHMEAEAIEAGRFQREFEAVIAAEMAEGLPAPVLVS